MRSLLLLLLVPLVLSAGCGRSTEGKFGPELYEISCAGCHGDRGQGAVLGPEIGTADSNSARNLSDEQIFGAIRVGPGSMPGNPLLTDEQIRSLVDYLRRLQQNP